MTQEPKIIEFVCSGNNGRSPLAQGFGEKYLQELGVTGYEVTSSGTRVNEIADIRAKKRPLPEKEARWALTKGLERHLFEDGNAIKRLLECPFYDPANADTMQAYAHHALFTFIEEEADYRREAFQQFELGEPKLTHDQTVVVPGTILILGMEHKHIDFVNGIYQISGYYPKIHHLEAYAGFELTHFKDAFGGTPQYYQKMARRMKLCVERSIDILLTGSVYKPKP